MSRTAGLWIGAVCCLMFSPSIHTEELDLQRGRRNYHAIMAGEKKLETLSETQKREVLA